ncbi:hypothetical protein KIL84_005008 [Mauremys mutica]|uniref:Uncharacterized protein n=1 Tax=Mauremys mutica TaxID=74926 RepID=A0A9D3XJU6_9SAUR|nr:hypothetical protein KIL84_005008 [Mauremys mutica]
MWQVFQLGAASAEEKIQSREGSFRFLVDACAFRCLVICTALITLASPLETRCTLDLCLPHTPHQLTQPTIQLGDQERCHQLRMGVCAPLDTPAGVQPEWNVAPGPEGNALCVNLKANEPAKFVQTPGGFRSLAREPRQCGH